MRSRTLNSLGGFCVLGLAAAFIPACTGKSSNEQARPSPAAVASPGTSGAAASPQAQGTIPPEIPERLRRPLTDAEIMRLPPETRDMILRAQGKPIPSPSPSSSPSRKKKTK